mgnify:CR=1 FL=1
MTPTKNALLQPEGLRKVFDRLDVNDNGYVGVQDLRQCSEFGALDDSELEFDIAEARLIRHRMENYATGNLNRP